METSRPWTSTTPGDAGPYSSRNWQDVWRHTLHGLRPNMGAIIDSGSAPDVGLQVQATSPASAAVDVLVGSALVAGIFYHNDATETLAIAANVSGNPRIDTLVLTADYTAQTVRLEVLTGTPAATPAPPSLTQTVGTEYQIPLADVAVANGFVTIGNGDIRSRHEWANAADGVYLKDVLNNSGVTLQTGSPVVWDSTADRAVTATTTQGNTNIAGVWQGRTNNAAYGRVLVRGIGLVYVAGSVSRGDLLQTSTTAQAATNQAYPLAGGIIGHALEARVGAGLVLAYVNVDRVITPAYAWVQDQKASGTNAANYTLGAWRTRELNAEVADPNGLLTVAANQITLVPGQYWVWFNALTVNVVAENRLRLYNVSDGTVIGQSANARSNGSDTRQMTGWAVFTISSSKVIELQHYPTATGLGGVAVTTGQVEVYANILFLRVGEG